MQAGRMLEVRSAIESRVSSTTRREQPSRTRLSTTAEAMA